MLKSFQGFQPKQVIYVILLGVLFWLPAFLLPGKNLSLLHLYPSIASPVLEPLSRLPGFPLTLVSFLFWFLIGYLLVFMNVRHLFLKTRTLLPLFFILTLSTPVLGFFEINNLTLVFPFLLIALHLVFNTYRKNTIDFTIYSAALWIGIASLICSKSSVFLLIIWVSLLSIRPFYFREWFASLAGFLTPWFFLFAIHFLLFNEITSLVSGISNDFLAPYLPLHFDTLQWVFLIYLGVLVLFSSVFLIFSMPGLKIKTRKFYGVLVWNILLTVSLGIVFPAMWLSFIPLFCLFISLFFSFYFQAGGKSLVKRILFDLYVTGLIYILVIRIA